MKSQLPLFALLCLSLVPTNRALAQIEQGDFRLHFDLSVLSYTAQSIRGTVGETAVASIDGTLSLGTGVSTLGAAGFGLAYAASEHWLPGVYLSYQRFRYFNRQEVGTEDTDGPERIFNDLELRPYCEAAVNPDSSVVGYGLFGFSYLRRSYVSRHLSDGDGGSGDSQALDISNYGIGPVFGVGVHAFAGQRASFDFGFTVRYLFRHDEYVEEQLEDTDLAAIELREVSAMLLLGASFWP